MRTFEFKDDAEPQGSSDGFWYDISEGGYIDLDVLKDPKDIEDIQNAVKLLEDFKYALEEAELVEEF